MLIDTYTTNRVRAGAQEPVTEYFFLGVGSGLALRDPSSTLMQRFADREPPVVPFSDSAVEDDGRWTANHREDGKKGVILQVSRPTACEPAFLRIEGVSWWVSGLAAQMWEEAQYRYVDGAWKVVLTRIGPKA